LVYRIIVPGIPRSSRARSRSTWMNQVSSIAESVCTSPLEGDDLVIDITIYYTGLPTFDNDNVLKPICDALEGVCYHNDHQISEHRIRRRALKGFSGSIKDVSPELFEALKRGDDFVSIEISRVSPSQEEQED